MAKIIYNGKKYDLPKKTMAITDFEDAMRTPSATLKEAYTKQFDFLKSVLNDENIEEMLGSSDLLDVDVTEVTLLCNMIDDAYNEKIVKQQVDHANKVMSQKAIENTIKFANSAEKLKSR